MITVNMNKAKDIWRDKIRQERAPILQAKDVEFMRAVEAGDTAKQQEIARQKQALRDATKAPEIDSASTPEELKAVDPLAQFR